MTVELQMSQTLVCVVFWKVSLWVPTAEQVKP